MGQRRPGVTFRAGFLGSIGDTIAIGRVVYYGNVPVVLDDGSWVPASDNIIAGAIVPIGGIDLFIDFTKNASLRDFADVNFPRAICLTFPEAEKSEEKLGFPFAVYDGEANLDDEPEQIYSFPEETERSDVEPEIRYSSLEGMDYSEEDDTLPYPEVRGVFYTDDTKSESQTHGLIKNPDSVLSVIEEE
jgi:hypothetical protein